MKRSTAARRTHSKRIRVIREEILTSPSRREHVRAKFEVEHRVDEVVIKPDDPVPRQGQSGTTPLALPAAAQPHARRARNADEPTSSDTAHIDRTTERQEDQE